MHSVHCILMRCEQDTTKLNNFFLLSLSLEARCKIVATHTLAYYL